MGSKIKMLPIDKMEMELGNMTLDLDFSRVEKKFQKAQYELDTAVMNSMEPFMPKQNGTFINKTKAASAAVAGTGIVYAAIPPEGRFLYEGKSMVDEKTGSPWARKGAKKVLVSQFGGKTQAKENLDFSTHANPKAQAHWFEAAKKQDLGVWVEKAKKPIGGK